MLNIKNFRKIDEWYNDSYTKVITILTSNRSNVYTINENVIIDGDIRKGSYIGVKRDEKSQIIAAKILKPSEFNKLLQQQKTR